jgi:hypothetical protein
VHHHFDERWKYLRSRTVHSLIQCVADCNKIFWYLIIRDIVLTGADGFCGAKIIKLASHILKFVQPSPARLSGPAFWLWDRWARQSSKS